LIQERKYLKNVTSKTLAWYEQSFRAFEGALESAQTIKQRLINLREKGVSAVSINTYPRCVNAYLKWTGSDLKIPRLTEEKRILKTFTSVDSQRLLDYKPKSKSQARVQALAILLLDTGLRIAEALALRASDIDLDNFLITVRNGKGRKQRLIPFSIARRKTLYRLVRSADQGYLFATKGATLSIRNAQHDL
jgi:integrase/recombinase XerD